MNNLIFIDFETFLDKKAGFDLKEISMIGYIRSPQFKVHGLAVASEEGTPEWMREPDETIPWDLCTVVAHNCKFDATILAEKYGIAAPQYIDTKSMAKAVLGKRVKGYSLKILAEYFGLPEKGEMKTDGIRDLTAEQEKELAEYCIHDTELCRQIFFKLLPEFPKNQWPIMDWTIRSFVQPKLVLNTKLLEEASKEEEKRREELINKTGIDKAIFSSNPKFAKLLTDKGFEVPHKKSPRSGKLIPALALGDVEFINAAKDDGNKEKYELYQARIAAKSTLLETRTAKLAEISKTGPWPFDVEYSGAVQTHRFSGGGGAGGNPQNFTKKSALRRAVEAPEGHSLICADFSQIEARLVAYLSRDPGLINVIETQPDLYCDFGSAFYGRIITKKDEEERKFAKTAILGLGYSMFDEKFQKTVKLQTGQDISLEEASRAVLLYRKRYSKVPELWDFLEKFIPNLTNENNGRLGTLPLGYEKEAIILPSGLKMRYPELYSYKKMSFGRERLKWSYKVWEKVSEKEDKNLYGAKVLENICQGLAGEICKEVLASFMPYVYGQVHDELILVVREKEAEAIAAALKKRMETPPMWLSRIKLAAEVKIGKNWLECK